MNWIEIITLRQSTAEVERPDNNLILSLKEKCGINGLMDVRVYRHESIETDLSIHLLWDLARVNSKGSDEANHIVLLLKEYGLVNHSVWVEESVRTEK
jgi:hypothetical protein